MKSACITFLAFTGIYCLPLFSQSGWNVQNSGTSRDLFGIHFVNFDTGYAAGAAGTVLRTTNGGTSWQNVSPAGVTADLNGVSAFDPGRVVVVGNGGVILLTTNGGTNWDTVSSGVNDNLLSTSFAAQAGVCGGTSQTIVRSSNAGGTWNVAQSGFFGGGFWGASMLSPQIGYVCGENSIFQPLLGKTTDGGVNWDFTPFYLDNNEGRAYGVDFTDESNGYVAARVWDGRGAVARTTDGGANWTTLFFSAPLSAIDFPASATGLIGYAVGMEGRIVKTTNAGTSWQQQSSSTTRTLRGVHFLDLDNGYVAGDSGLILKTTTGGDPPTGIGGEDRWHPGTFSLLQNYPNPFNSSTVISFELPRAEFVALSVYNVLGEEVARLLLERREAGAHRVGWGAEGLPSGVYYYRVRVGEFVQVRKMVLLR